MPRPSPVILSVADLLAVAALNTPCASTDPMGHPIEGLGNAHNASRLQSDACHTRIGCGRGGQHHHHSPTYRCRYNDAINKKGSM